MLISYGGLFPICTSWSYRSGSHRGKAIRNLLGSPVFEGPNDMWTDFHRFQLIGLLLCKTIIWRLLNVLDGSLLSVNTPPPWTVFARHGTISLTTQLINPPLWIILNSGISFYSFERPIAHLLLHPCYLFVYLLLITLLSLCHLLPHQPLGQGQRVKMALMLYDFHFLSDFILNLIIQCSCVVLLISIAILHLS